MMLLTMKTKVVLQWSSRIQSTTLEASSTRNERIWIRWRKEFLQTITKLRKRNFQVGDVVLLKNEEKRNNWPMARISKVHQNEFDKVRTVTLVTQDRNEITRPISNIVLLCNSPPCESGEPDVNGVSSV